MSKIKEWDEVVNEYDTLISPFNNIVINEAISQLPDKLIDGPIFTPGVGPGHELKSLNEKYPDAKIIASDYSSEMVNLAKTRASKISKNISVEQMDLFDLHKNKSALTVSFFLTHIMPEPVKAAMVQWDSVQLDGHLALVYVPKQINQGPLFSYFKAIKEVTNFSKPDWEIELVDKLKDHGVKNLELKEIPIEWSFANENDFRVMMDSLPQMKMLKTKLGESKFEEIWTHWSKSTGLSFSKNKFRGAVTMRLLIARK